VQITRRIAASAFALAWIAVAVAPAAATPGDTLWTKTYDGPSSGRDTPRDMVIDPVQYRVYVVGTTQDGTSSDIVTIAYDLYTGSKIWSRRYDGPAHGSDLGVAIAYDPYSRGVTVTGASEESAGTGRVDAVTISYLLDGSRQWVRRVTNPDADFPAGLTVIDGSTYLFVHSTHGRLIAYDPGGQRRWARDVTTGDLAEAVDLESIGDYLLAVGRSQDAAGTAIITSAFGTDGTAVWTKRFAGPLHDAVAADAAVGAGGSTLYVTGLYGDGTSRRITTVAYDPHDGYRFWRRAIAPQALGELDLRPNIAVSDDGAAIAVATGSQLNGVSTFLTRLYHSDGSIAWTARENGPTDAGQVADVAIGVGGTVYVTGSGTNNGSAQGPFTVGYPSTGPPSQFETAVAPTDLGDGATCLVAGPFGDRVFVGSRVAGDLRVDAYAAY
jgi:putative pyrroloquinoline-quinone binding quinoprotein